VKGLRRWCAPRILDKAIKLKEAPIRLTCAQIDVTWAAIKQVRAVPALAALRTGQLSDQDTGPILEEVETGQPHSQKLLGPKEISRCLQRHWVSVEGRSKIAQIVLPRSRVNEVLTELHGGPSGGHPG
jgi:hypothetical protein